MMIVLPLLICLIGLLAYAIASPAAPREKITEVGRVMFWCGLLAFLLRYAGALSIVR